VALCAKAGTEILLAFKDTYSMIKVDFTRKTIYVLHFLCLNKVSIINSDIISKCRIWVRADEKNTGYQ
jgi:hypothetical protein